MVKKPKEPDFSLISIIIFAIAFVILLVTLAPYHRRPSRVSPLTLLLIPYVR
jgi:hypothetical protein